MANQPDSKISRPPFECIALLLQGGGALGAYQGGIYEAMARHGLHPDWIAGISIGAINAAIIAGNPPEKRVQNLRQFWEEITTPCLLGQSMDTKLELLKNDMTRAFLNKMSAYSAMMNGVSNFYAPRVATWLNQNGALNTTSYYDTSLLKATLERLVDFDRINTGPHRFCVGAVNVTTGNFTYFDTTTHTIKPEHIMASCALPPAFPSVEVDGENYWDGGLVSNTPLQWLVDITPRIDSLVFQVDLWSTDGKLPKDMAEVMTRAKEIQYSSRTRAQTDRFKQLQKSRYALATLLEQLPPELKDSAEAKLLSAAANHKVYNIVHLIYHAKDYEGDSKDYEFSRLSMEDHWKAGREDMERTLSHPEILQRPTNPEGINIYDFCQKHHTYVGSGRKSAMS